MGAVDKRSDKEVVRGNPHRTAKIVAGTGLLTFWLIDAASLHLIRNHFGVAVSRPIGWAVFIVAVVLLIAGAISRRR